MIVTANGDVIRGDLHINNQSWTQWPPEYEIIAEFKACGCNLADEIRSEGLDPEDDDEYDCWVDAYKSAHRRYAANMANAIVRGLPTEDISIDLAW